MTTSCADRITTKGIKVASASQDLGNLWSCNHSTDRYPISNALEKVKSVSVDLKRTITDINMVYINLYFSSVLE